MVDFPLIPSKAALLNVDLQGYFVDTTPGGAELLERLNRLARVCRGCGVLVVHTAHVLRPDGSNIGVMGDIIPVIREGLIHKGSETAALHDNLDIQAQDILLDKPRFGAFHGTDLEVILRSKGIDTLIVGGIATNLCCETTAREANARDFRVFFLRDGTATSDIGDLSADEIQRATCTTLGFAFVQLISVEEMVDKIQAAKLLEGGGPPR